MNSIRRQLVTFAGVLAGLYTIGVIAGQLIDAKPHGGKDAHGEASMGHEDGKHGAEADPVRGLALSENGLRLVLATPELQVNDAEQLRFQVVDAYGEAVRDFDVTHERRMHLIIARRDLSGFQHLHPTIADDGTWSTNLRLDEPGSYRVLADFSHQGRAITLASDLRIDGDADLRPLPDPQTTAVSDGGYDVRLKGGDAAPGKETELRFEISRDGVQIRTEPYLGAGGHLVALREGDLAFLHVHPTEHGADSDNVGFAATFPTAGRFRLFLQFQHAGQVQTVAFTQEVA